MPEPAEESGDETPRRTHWWREAGLGDVVVAAAMTALFALLLGTKRLYERVSRDA
jgi:hypothetical protein